MSSPGALLLQELALLDYSCLRHEPSRLAAAALLVAEAHTGLAADLSRLTAVTGYSPVCLQVRPHPPPPPLARLHCPRAALCMQPSFLAGIVSCAASSAENCHILLSDC